MTDRPSDPVPYQVVMNHEEQYSIWRDDAPPPPGWRMVGVGGDRETCLEHIRAVWTDMRPLSLRRAMAGQDS